MVRDPKGWRIDRRRSVTRYSCQQAAGIVSPLSAFRLLLYPISCTSLARQLPRSLASRGCTVIQEYSPRKCSIDVFSATRSLDGTFLAPSVPRRVPFLAPRASPLSRLQRFIRRSWNTAAVTPSLLLIGNNCSIFLDRWSWCIDLELRMATTPRDCRYETSVSGKFDKEIRFFERFDGA